MANKARTTSGPQMWEAKWVQVPSMDHRRDARKHLCVVIAVDGDTVTLLPTSTKPVNSRPGQRPVLLGGVEVYPATNRVYTVTAIEWVNAALADAHHQPDRSVRGFLKQELCRA